MLLASTEQSSLKDIHIYGNFSVIERNTYYANR